MSVSKDEPTPQVEQVFHKRIWGTANAAHDVERAVTDGRDLAYAVLALTEPGTSYHEQAEHWLNTFGRNSLREAGRQSEVSS